MSSMKYLKQFDKSQLWRLFVDGRFQKKYNGWVGYEKGERGSVKALLNGFAFMLDNFDISGGLKATYLRELHKVCMLSVETTNLKSSPGDIRYLNAGMPFFAKSTTYEHLEEVFAMRWDDGTAIFNSKKFGKTANELNIDKVFAHMKKNGDINYRNWYPNLDVRLQKALEGKTTLHEFYEAKHAVQMLIISKMEEIIERYNHNIRLAKTDEEKLEVIALVPRELELLHPFPDGNSRTFSCVTLTQLLLYHGFYPALLENPNLDNEVSLAQWVEEIKKGMERTKVLLDDQNARLFNYSILDMSQRDRNKFLKMAEEVTQKVDQHTEIYLTPERLESLTNGKWIGDDFDRNLRFTGVGTYGTYSKGNLYFATGINEWIEEGKNPHEELHRILDQGMRALVLDDLEYARDANIPFLLVKDSFKAFKQAAIQVRQEVNPFTILITGTEGKTGAKVQLNHLLNRQLKAHAVINSANTEVPVLRSLIALEPDHEVEINEVSVGNDEPYRVERSKMVNPDLCLFTNIGPNHMDLHKTMNNIINAKSSVVEGLRARGKCILNSSIEHHPALVKAIHRRRPETPIITYGRKESDKAMLISQTFDAKRLGWHVEAMIDVEAVSYFLPILQEHSPMTSVGILLAMREMGLDVQKAALDYEEVLPYETMGRVLTLKKRSGEVQFYDQSRRGGIQGMHSAFNDLKRLKSTGKVVALVGGISIKYDTKWTKKSHAELATMINDSKIERLYTTGSYMNYVTEKLNDPSIFVKHSDDLDDLAASLFNEVKGGDLLFIIGSAYLYLGRVTDRILKLKDASRLNHEMAESLSSKQRETYKSLAVFDEIERDTSLELALISNDLPEKSFKRFRKKYPTFVNARAEILMGFFESLDRLVIAFGMQQVNSDIVETGKISYVWNPDFCQRWFNNLDKKPGIKSKQLFGSFYDFGDPEYLLYVEIATMNLHVGFTRYEKRDDKFCGLKMTPQDEENAAKKFKNLEKLGIELKPRKWGLKCHTHDCGRFIDIMTSYGTMANLAESELYKGVIEPICKGLKGG